MATVKNIKINVDTKEAVNETDKLAKSFDKLDKEAEKTSKSVDDVAGNGGAIAILDQLTGGLATRFKDAYEATKLFNFSLKGTSKALIATGVGAFVVALGLIVAYWDDITEAIEGSNVSLEDQLALINTINKNLNGQLATIDKQIELNKLQGKANESLEAQKVAILTRLQEQNNAETQILKNQLTRLKATSTEAGLWEGIVSDVKLALFGGAAYANDVAKGAVARLTAIRDLETQIEAANLAAIDLDITLFKINNPELGEGVESVDRAKEMGIKNGLTIEDNLRLDSKLLLNERLKELGNEEVEIRRGTAEDILKAEKILINTKQELRNIDIDNIKGVLNIVALLGQESKALQAGVLIATNAAGVAKTIVNTQAANAIALSEGVALAIPTGGASSIAATALVAANNLSAGISIATSVAATAKGLSQLGGGGNVSGGGTPGGRQAAAPSFNLVSGTASNQIANSVNSGTTPARAFVVSTSVTSQQSLDRNAESDGSL